VPGAGDVAQKEALSGLVWILLTKIAMPRNKCLNKWSISAPAELRKLGVNSQATGKPPSTFNYTGKVLLNALPPIFS
jgi:hypothetical protein